MFVLSLDFLTAMMLILFSANVFQTISEYMSGTQPQEITLVAASTAVGYATYNLLYKQFDEAYIFFEKMTVSLLGEHYWILIILVSIFVAAILAAIKKITSISFAF